MSYTPIEKEGVEGVDRWTANGYGLILNGEQVEPLNHKKFDEIKEGGKHDSVKRKGK